MLLRGTTFRVALLVGVLVTTWLLFSFHNDNFIFHPLQLTARHDRYRNILDDIDDNGAFGFEKILVVGLPSRTDRRDSMVLQAAISNVEIDFIDGVKGDSVPDSAIPLGRDTPRPAAGTLGSWRAHVNAIQEVVRRNLTSALILEDDTDWDVRIRSQLRRFALSSQALIQPLSDPSNVSADPTTPDASNEIHDGVGEISFDDLPSIVSPTKSPYGDNWDVLWLGHCGMRFPAQDQDAIPQGRVVHAEDVTAPERRYLYSLTNGFPLVEQYPDHTRIVHHVQEGVCSLAYAVSQQGARQLLQEVALKDVSDPFDLLLRFFCEGERGRRKHTCLTVQPAVFNHHRRAGPDSAQSDIGDHGGGWRDESLTDMVRWSTRLNANVLIDGGDVFRDSFPNTE